MLARGARSPLPWTLGGTNVLLRSDCASAIPHRTGPDGGSTARRSRGANGAGHREDGGRDRRSDPPDARRRRARGARLRGWCYRLTLIGSRRRRRSPSPPVRRPHLASRVALALWRTVAPLVAKQADLQARYEAALADALTDPLTGLGNHRAFHEELDRQVAAALRYDVPLVAPSRSTSTTSSRSTTPAATPTGTGCCADSAPC